MISVKECPYFSKFKPATFIILYDGLYRNKYIIR